jgi:hypothetical protein
MRLKIRCDEKSWKFLGTKQVLRGPNKAPAPSTESAFKEQVIQSLFNISIAQHTGVALQVEVFSAQQVSSIVSATIFFILSNKSSSH